MEYPVTITETLSKTINIEAECMEDAILECKDLYYNGEIMLDAGDFTNVVEFEVQNATSIDRVIDKVSKDIVKVDGITLEQIKSSKKSPKIATARRVLYFILEHYYNYSRLDVTKKLNKTNSAMTVALRVWLNNDYIKKQEFSQYESVISKYK